VDFPGVAKKVFSAGQKVAKFHCNHSKLGKHPLLLKILCENVKFRNTWGARPLAPYSDAHVCIRSM